MSPSVDEDTREQRGMRRRREIAALKLCISGLVGLSRVSSYRSTANGVGARLCLAPRNISVITGAGSSDTRTAPARKGCQWSVTPGPDNE